MVMEKEEFENASLVLEKAESALINKDSISLKELSNKTIHSASIYQDSGSITTAVLIYTLSKIIERNDFQKVKSWDLFVKKINSIFDLAIDSLQKQKIELYEKYLLMARNSLTSISINLKPYIEEVFIKASINKASKIYEHGISLEKTSRLLGITQWELLEYIGQRNISDIPQNESIPVEKRAKMALEFFS